MNIAGAETLHVRFKNTVKTSKLTPVTFFFHITGGILVSFLGFVLVKKSSDTESKDNTVFGKNHIFRIFQNNPLKVIPKFVIFGLFSINFEKKTLFFLLFSRSLTVCCLPVMFSAESEMFRNVHH